MVAMAIDLQQDHSLKTIHSFKLSIMTGKCDKKQLLLHHWETLSEHNLSIMTVGKA